MSRWNNLEDPSIGDFPDSYYEEDNDYDYDDWLANNYGEDEDDE